MKKHMVQEKSTACQCLDFVEAAFRHRVYPLIYCHMDFSGRLDPARLKQAVARSAQIVPEILFVYDFRKGRFVASGYTADDIILLRTAASAVPPLGPDLSKRPQLQIILTPERNQEHAVFVMSHILADGKGFLQYLYLLAYLYNGGRLNQIQKNKRSIAPLLKNIHILSPTEQTRRNHPLSLPPLRSSRKGSSRFCLTAQIPPESMALLHQKAKQSGVTMNDIFMTAYARVIARLQHTEAVVLPCPSDLRRFFPQAQDKAAGFTIANMTGIYRNIAIELKENVTFDSALQQVHIELALQKSRYRCFSGIRLLHRAFRRIPAPLMRQIIRAAYRAAPVSYSNIGTIDETKLYFQDCPVLTCFITGTYRLPPDFQLTVSTFRSACTLNCTLLGPSDSRQRGQLILDQVKQELLAWIGLEDIPSFSYPSATSSAIITAKPAANRSVPILE